MLIEVFIPVDESLCNIVLGSAVVGIRQVDKSYNLYYEGQKYEQRNLQIFADRVSCATERALQKYPTSARRFGVPEHGIKLVAHYDIVFGQVTPTDLESAKDLMKWLNLKSLRGQMGTSNSLQSSLRTVATWPVEIRKTKLSGLPRKYRDIYINAGLL